MREVEIRKARPEDMQGVWNLIRELAVYEEAGEELEIRPETLIEDGFGADPKFHCLVAVLNSEIVGMMLYYETYSTWKGRALYLEDFVVQENYRKLGVGLRLFDALIQEAKHMKANRLRWQVIDWNEPAISFYKKIKADLDSAWVNCTLTREEIQAW